MPRNFQSISLVNERVNGSNVSWLSPLLSLLALTTCCGCINFSYLERWGGGNYGQGDLARQSSRAEFFDPYPLNDIGPDVVGGRPREYANPRPEASRNLLDRRDVSQQRRSTIPGAFSPGMVLPGQQNPGWGTPWNLPAYPIYQQPVSPGFNNGGYILPQFGGMNSSMMPVTPYAPQTTPAPFIGQ